MTFRRPIFLRFVASNSIECNQAGANDNPAGGDGWSKLREAHTKALLIPNTGMAVSIDTVPLNEAGDIQPKNKFDVGSRLARWSLSRDYG